MTENNRLTDASVRSSEFSKALKKLDPHLSLEIVTKDSANVDLNGDFLEVNQQAAGDVIVKYNDDSIVTLKEVEATPVMELGFTYVDRINAPLVGDLIKLCGEYLPEKKEDEV